MERVSWIISIYHIYLYIIYISLYIYSDEMRKIQLRLDLLQQTRAERFTQVCVWQTFSTHSRKSVFTRRLIVVVWGVFFAFGV